MALLKVTPSAGNITIEKLRISRHKRRANATLNVVQFVDKDTKQVVCFVPSVDVSAYGETEHKARRMLDETMSEFFKYLFDLSTEELNAELFRLGWSKPKYFNKEFSKAYVDNNGDLQGFNADENSIKTLTLTAA